MHEDRHKESHHEIIIQALCFAVIDKLTLGRAIFTVPYTLDTRKVSYLSNELFLDVNDMRCVLSLRDSDDKLMIQAYLARLQVSVCKELNHLNLVSMGRHVAWQLSIHTMFALVLSHELALHIEIELKGALQFCRNAKEVALGDDDRQGILQEGYLFAFVDMGLYHLGHH